MVIKDMRKIINCDIKKKPPEDIILPGELYDEDPNPDLKFTDEENEIHLRESMKNWLL